ncbi:hypothetical protein FB451DRAFT_460422 [Mycena latifolia]|nr:hypothetical protein FB451DRAFT_460422 [Mycena latifolia]
MGLSASQPCERRAPLLRTSRSLGLLRKTSKTQDRLRRAPLSVPACCWTLSKVNPRPIYRWTCNRTSRDMQSTFRSVSFSDRDEINQCKDILNESFQVFEVALSKAPYASARSAGFTISSFSSAPYIEHWITSSVSFRLASLRKRQVRQESKNSFLNSLRLLKFNPGCPQFDGRSWIYLNVGDWMPSVASFLPSATETV